MPWPMDDKPVNPLLYGSRVGNAVENPPEPPARRSTVLRELAVKTMGSNQ